MSSPPSLSAPSAASASPQEAMEYLQHALVVMSQLMSHVSDVQVTSRIANENQVAITKLQKQVVDSFGNLKHLIDSQTRALVTVHDQYCALLEEHTRQTRQQIKTDDALEEVLERQVGLETELKEALEERRQLRVRCIELERQVCRIQACTPSLARTTLPYGVLAPVPDTPKRLDWGGTQCQSI